MIIGISHSDRQRLQSSVPVNDIHLNVNLVDSSLYYMNPQYLLSHLPDGPIPFGGATPFEIPYDIVEFHIQKSPTGPQTRVITLNRRGNDFRVQLDSVDPTAQGTLIADFDSRFNLKVLGLIFGPLADQHHTRVEVMQSFREELPTVLGYLIEARKRLRQTLGALL